MNTIKIKTLLIIVGTIIGASHANAQYSCATAVEIPSIPFNVSNLTTSSGASYTASGFCGQNTNYDEQDYIFENTFTVDEFLNLNMSHNNFLTKCGIYVFTDCAQPPVECVAFSEGFSSSELTFVANAGQQYYIFIGTATMDNFSFQMNKEEIDGIAINKSAPTQVLDVNGSIRIGEGTTTPYEGTVRWNSSLKELQAYNGSLWESLKTRNINDLDDAYSLLSDGTLKIPSQGIPNYGNFSTIIGHGISGSGSSNTIFGYGAGNLATGSGNVFIGNGAGSGISASNTLIIENNPNASANDPPLIYGDFHRGKLLINKDPQDTLLGEIFGVSGLINTFSGDIAGMYINIESNDGYAYYGFSHNNVATSELRAYDSGSLEYKSYISNARFGVQDNADFFINGDIAYKGIAGSWTGFSDSRLKKNITNLDKYDMLDKVISMQGVNYEWNDTITEFNRPEGQQIGFIAQDLQKIWPEKIIEDELGYLQTAYGDYDPVFVEAIKALAEKVEKQSIEIELLKTEMNAFKSKDEITLSGENK